MTIIRKYSETEVGRLAEPTEEVIKLDLYLDKIRQLSERIANLRNEAAKFQSLLVIAQAEYDEARRLGVKLSSEITPPPDENPPG